jgi:DNA primase
MRSKSPSRGKNRRESGFRRASLPDPTEYYHKQRVKLTGGGEWKNAICPFHDDTRPSLRVHLESGAFRCWACGKRGGDVLDFHRERYRLDFEDAAKQLGAWEMES